MRVNSLIEFLDCAVNTRWVEGPYEEQGGILICGPPGSFKTTIISTALDPYPSTLVVSDLNVQQWLKLKDDFVTGRYSCLGFTDFEKLYQRHQAVAQNIEGIVRALVSEGFGTGPGGDQRMPRIVARALVVGGLTQNCLERNWDHWQKNGLLRRFILLVIGVKNPEAIVRAIRKWKKIEFGRVTYRPANREIPMSIGKERTSQLESMMKTQSGFHGTGYVLLKKIAAVMEWKMGGKKTTELLNDLSPAFSKEGGYIDL